MAPVTELNLTAAALFTQGAFLVLVLIGIAVLMLGKKLTDDEIKDFPLRLIAYWIVAILLTFGIIVLSPTFSALWSPVIGQIRFQGPAIGIGVSLLLGVDLILVAALVWSTGTSHDSPFASLYFLIPVLAIMLRQSVFSVWVLAVLAIALFIVTASFDRPDDALEVGFGLRPWSAGIVVVASFVIATWLGTETIPRKPDALWWPTYGGKAELPPGTYVTFPDVLDAGVETAGGRNMYIHGVFSVQSTKGDHCEAVVPGMAASEGHIEIYFPAPRPPPEANTVLRRSKDRPFRIIDATKQARTGLIIRAEEIFEDESRLYTAQQDLLIRSALIRQLRIPETPEAQKLVFDALGGDPRAIFECGTFLYPSEHPSGLFFIEYAASLGSRNAMEWLSNAYANGRFGILKDATASDYWWNKRYRH